jgi:hypothetical protein
VDTAIFGVGVEPGPHEGYISGGAGALLHGAGALRREPRTMPARPNAMHQYIISGNQNRGTRTKLLAAMAISLVVAACASSAPVIVGQVRPAIPIDQVKVYSHPPPAFEEIATLNASSRKAFSPGGPQQIDKVVEQLKQQAAQLGANGIILEGFSDTQSASVGTGASSQSYSRNSSVGLGVGGSFGIFKKTGRGRAIFVPPG